MGAINESEQNLGVLDNGEEDIDQQHQERLRRTHALPSMRTHQPSR
jgi:hypothetical protein